MTQVKELIVSLKSHQHRLLKSGNAVTLLVVGPKLLYSSCAWKQPTVVSPYLSLLQSLASVQIFIFLCF